MNKKLTFRFIIFLLFLAGCGPSPEQAASMTASAWTPTPAPTSTPLPTATATPIPYDLTVKVTGADGVPVAGASLSFEGGVESVITDENGMAEWKNLAGPDGSVAIAAVGYFASEQTFNLNRGPNDLTFALERDPNGLLPSQACAPGESLLYIEDFQDGNAQGMDAVNFKAGGWSIVSAPDLAENSVMTLALPDSYGGRVSENDQINLMDQVFENAAMRLRIQVTGHGEYTFSWRQVNQPYQTSAGEASSSRYIIVAGTKAGGRGDQATGFLRTQPPLVDLIVADRATEYLKLNEWHLLEISTFDGDTKVWLDGKEIMNYVDPQPLPGGGIGISADKVKPGALAYYDNISVCGLNAPFATLYSVP